MNPDTGDLYAEDDERGRVKLRGAEEDIAAIAASVRETQQGQDPEDALRAAVEQLRALRDQVAAD